MGEGLLETPGTVSEGLQGHTRVSERSPEPISAALRGLPGPESVKQGGRGNPEGFRNLRSKRSQVPTAFGSHDGWAGGCRPLAHGVTINFKKGPGMYWEPRAAWHNKPFLGAAAG